MLHRAFALLFGMVCGCVFATQAPRRHVRPPATTAFGDIAPGTYQAGDNVRFSLDRYQNEFLMRFAGQPEVFVLYADLRFARRARAPIRFGRHRACRSPAGAA